MSNKSKALLERKRLYEYRVFSHVYRIDDDVMDTVRRLLTKLGLTHSLDDDDLMDVSDFLSVTKKPYRAKSKIYG